MPPKWLSSDHVTLHTYSSGCHGFAATLGSSWFASSCDDDLVKYQIAVKELVRIVLAIEILGSSMRDKKVLFMSDNMAVLHIMNNQTSKDKSIVHLIRRLVLATLSYNIHFRAKHIPGKHNVTTDRLSRFQFQAAFQSSKQVDRVQTPIPLDLLKI